MRTIHALFDDYSAAKQAVVDLEALGIPSDEISIVSRNHDDDGDTAAAAGVGAGLGAAVGGTGGLLAGLGMMAIPGVGPVVAAGWLAATLAGAAGGAVVGGAAGGLIGALTDSGVAEDEAHFYAEGVRRGGHLVTARVDDELYGSADAVLHAGRIDVAERRRIFADDGWTRFDPELPPYTAEEIKRQRLLYRL